MKKLWEYLYFKQPLILPAVFSAIFIFSFLKCTPDGPPPNLSKNFALPETEMFTAADYAVASRGASLTDTTLADGTRLITIRIPPNKVPPVDTVKPPPIDTSRLAGVGINTFPWIPLDRLQMFSTVRVYIASGWIWRPGGLFAQPMYQAETAEAHGLDDYFTACKNKGIDVLPCINQSPDWQNGYSQGIGSNDYPPIKQGLNREDPNNWKEYAEFWYQFTARYGNNKNLDPSTIRVDQTPRWNNDVKNVVKVGLGLIKAVEIGNEWDRWWDYGTPKYLTPKEHAAMFTAVTHAIWRADKTIKIIHGGLTGFDKKYLTEFYAELVKFGCPYPHAINLHYYTHEGNQYGKWPPTWWNSGATYPELDKGFTYLNEIKTFAKSIGSPIWITEYGADTNPESWMHVKGSKWGIGDEQAQGELITRTIKEYNRQGVERTYIFMAADEPGVNGGLWQTCGIMGNKASGYRLKPSYYAVKDLIEQIKTKQAQTWLYY